MQTKLLLIGSNGQVGRELVPCLQPLGELVIVNRDVCDLTNASQIQNVIRSEKPQFVINASAYTQVDLAEDEKDLCMQVNAEAPAVMAKECHEIGATLIHYSTDYVFNGNNDQPWTETDLTDPKNVYGESKLKGEEGIASSGCNYLILRTSWVYGLHGKNFLLTMLRLAESKESLNVVDDQIGAPTWSRMIAMNTGLVLNDLIRTQKEVKETIHFAAAGKTSWCGFTKEIIRIASKKNELVLNNPDLVNPIPSEAYPQKAYRPKYSVMSTDKLKETFNIQMPEWKEQLKACLSFL